MNNSIWLIEVICLDPSENDGSAAVTYNPFGYVETESEAKEFCGGGKICTRDDCWALFTPKPEYRYKEIGRV